MSVFVDWLMSPLVQGMLISPLIGAIMGLLLSGGGNNITGDVTIHQTNIIFRNEIRIKQINQNNSSDDGMSLLIIGVIVIATLLWGYSRYALLLIDIWMKITFFSLSFIFTAGIATYIRNQYLKKEWMIHIFTPFIFGIFSLFLAVLAEKGIIRGAAEATYNSNIFYYFFKVLNEEQKIWLFFQIFGFLTGIVASIGTALVSLFYLSLLNQSVSSRFQQFWFKLAKITSFFSQFKGAVFLIILIFLSYFFLSGYAFKFYIRY